MATKYQQKFPIPEKFYEIIHDFAREVLRDQPEDILEYAAQYFESMRDGTQFQFDSKYNVKGDRTNPTQYKPKPAELFDTSKPPARTKVSVPKPELKVKPRPESRQKAESKPATSQDNVREYSNNAYAELNELDAKRNLESRGKSREAQKPQNQENTSNENQEAQVSEDRPEKEMLGKFSVPLIQGINIDNGREASYFCKVCFPDGNTLETDYVQSAEPEWQIENPTECTIMDSLEKKILIELYENGDYETVRLGTAVIPVSNLAWCTKWSFNNAVKIRNGDEEVIGELNVQISWAKHVPKKVFSGPIPKPEAESIPKEVGFFLLRFICARNLTNGTSTPVDAMCKLVFPGGKRVETYMIPKNNNPQWNMKTFVNFEVPLEELGPIQVEMYDGEKAGKKLIGSTTISFDDLKYNSGSWFINHFLPLTPNPELGTEDAGEVYLQVKYIGQGSYDDKTEPVNILEQQKEEEEGPEVRGHFNLRVVRAKNLNNGSGPADSFCRFIFPGGKKAETVTVTKNNDPEYQYKTFVTIDTREKLFLATPITLEVWEKDLMSSTLIGSASISVEDCYYNAGAWVVNQYITLTPNPDSGVENAGEVYVQLRYLPAGMTGDPTEPEDVDVLAAKKANEINGTIVTRIVKARNLPLVDENMRPVCTIKVGGYDNTTYGADEPSNPNWDYTSNTNITVQKDQIEPFKVEVSNDYTVIAWTEIPWEDCVSNPVTWGVNRYVRLQGGNDFADKFDDFGEVYVQIKFIPEGQEDDGAEAEVIE